MDSPRITLSVSGGESVGLRVSDERDVHLRLTGASGAGGTTDYERLRNKPSIESVELMGNKDLSDFGVSVATDYDIALLFR